MSGSRRVRLRTCSFIEARRRSKPSGTRGLTDSVGSVALATSTTVWDRYFFGSCVATDRLSAAQPTAQTGMIHQCLRRTLLTSATVNSPSRTISGPFLKDATYSVAELHANCHGLSLRTLRKAMVSRYVFSET